MFGNIILAGILVAILYGSFLWTPWASLVIAILSSLAFSYMLFFVNRHIENIANEEPDKLSKIIGAGISYLSVVFSIVEILK